MFRNIVYCDKCEKKIEASTKYYSIGKIESKETLINGEYNDCDENEKIFLIDEDFCKECFIKFLNNLANEVKNEKEQD